MGQNVYKKGVVTPKVMSLNTTVRTSLLAVTSAVLSLALGATAVPYARLNIRSTDIDYADGSTLQTTVALEFPPQKVRHVSYTSVDGKTHVNRYQIMGVFGEYSVDHACVAIDGVQENCDNLAQRVCESGMGFLSVGSPFQTCYDRDSDYSAHADLFQKGDRLLKEVRQRNK